MRENILFYDVPLENIKLIGPSGYAIHEGALIVRGGFASAEVTIPEELRSSDAIKPHARSRFARLGLNVMLGHAEAERIRHAHSLPRYIQVTLVNYGSFPLLMRNGDTIALSNLKDTLLTSDTETLTAGDQRFEIIPDMLPGRLCGNEWMRYIDPQEIQFDSHVRAAPFDAWHVKEGMFVVINTQEHVHVPEGHIGVIHATAKSIVHTSSVLVHPRWTGNKVLLEFLALRNFEITRGTKLAIMTIHKSDSARFLFF